MLSTRAFFIIKVSCVLVILYVILQGPFNINTTMKWTQHLPHSTFIRSEKANLPFVLPAIKFYNGSTSSSGDYREVNDYRKTRINLEDGLNIRSRIVKEYALVHHINSSLQYSNQLLQKEEKHLTTPVWNLLPENKKVQDFIHRERAELADLVQGRIKALQNPDDCAKAKKLLCTVNINCGFGCVVHHVTYCFITAYHTNRTLILNQQWSYEGQSWNETFLPLSSTCLDGSGTSYGIWGGGGNSANAQVVAVGTFQMMDKYRKKPWAVLRPRRIPKEFESRLKKVSNDPLIWWVGQFVAYAMRLTPEMEKVVGDAKSKMRKEIPYNDSSIIPIGLHVRRTDKDTEAAYYPLKAYLSHVTRYLRFREKMEGKPFTGLVYLASDEPKVVQEARNLEKQTNKWKLQANESIARDAEELVHRFKSGILGILTDVMVLADCEFVVCTFSSNICRLVAELKEAEPELGEEVVSLDDPYHFINIRRAV